MSRSYVQPGLFVAGEWILDAAGRETLAVTNPANGQILAQLPLATASDLDAAIEAAGAAFAGWRGTPALQRSEIVRRAGALIRQRRDLIGQVIAQELGKPLQEALREADTAAEMQRRGPNATVVAIPEAGHAPALMAPEQIESILAWLDRT